MKIKLTHENIHSLCLEMANQIICKMSSEFQGQIQVFGVPRGGVPVAYMLEGILPDKFLVVDKAIHAHCIVDDIIDSGATRERWTAMPGKPHIPFFALIDKTQAGGEFQNVWVVFPWEGSEQEETGVEDNIVRLLQYIGEDPKRGGLLETPKRVAKAWTHWCSGYNVDIPGLLKTFEDGADGCDEMVLIRNIPFYTHCEHHMAPFFGTATVAYIPDGVIVGLSKIPRVVDAFARRLQVQERLTNQIADALQDNLKPKGVGVIIKARHLCMESRGIQQQGHETITSALRGVMRDLPEARAEFLDLAK